MKYYDKYKPFEAMIKITLRKKTISKGRESLFLDFYPAIPRPDTGVLTRREFLKFYTIAKPKTPLQRLSQKETLQLAEGRKKHKITNHVFFSLNSCFFHNFVVYLWHKLKSRDLMKKLHYIRNEETDENFDPMEMKFYPNNWEPEMEEDRDYLQSLIDDEPERFKDCVIETIETRTFE